METQSQNKWLVCPTCKEIPLLTHSVKDKDCLIFTNCKCCMKETKYTIENYFQQIENVNSIIMNLNKCSTHKEEKVVALCKKCNYTLLCSQCKSKHSDHSDEIKDDVYINNVFPYEKIHKLKEQFKLSSNFYLNQNIRMKNLIIEKLTKEMEEIVSYIELIEQNYELNANINKELSLFINNLLSNYEELYEHHKQIPLFYPIYNLINNTQFTCTKFEMEINDNKSLHNCANNLISYYKTTFIVQQPITIKENKNSNNTLSHQGFVYALSKLHNNNNQYASCSSDGTIKIWNIESNENICTIETKGEWIYSLCPINSHLLASGTSEGNIYLWNISDLSNIKHSKLQGHNLSVVKIIKLNQKKHIASCSFDKLIKIWDYQKERCVFTIKDNINNVTSVIQLKDGRLVSGSESEIRFYNCDDSFKFERNIKGIKCSWANALIQLESGQLAIGDENEIKIINVNTYEIEIILKGHLSWVCCLIELFPGCLISGGDDTEIKQWCILNQQMIQSIKGHEDGIRDVILLGRKLITCSDDNMIKVWEF